MEHHAGGGRGQPGGRFLEAGSGCPWTATTRRCARSDGESAPHLQRHCTRERQRARASALNARMRELPVDAPVRMAWDNRSNGDVWTTLPRESTAFTSDEFGMAFCIFLGLSCPLIVEARAGGLTHFYDIPARGRPGQRFERQLDVFGQNLSLYRGKGNFRIGMHDDVKRECAELANLCGLSARSEARDLFVRAVPPAHRDAYTNATRRRPRGGAVRGGIVVDIVVDNMPTFPAGRPHQQMFEVKTFGHKENKYGLAAAARPVDQREEEIPGDYVSLANRADQRFCGTPRGQEGPILNLLRSMDTVRGLVVGAYGEFGKGLDRFIGDLAKHGSRNPERFGCCHGADQAQGVISAMLRDRVGRVALRGAARTRLAALEAAMRRPGVGQEYAERHAHEVHDEWDRVRVRTYAPPPGQE